MNQAIEKQTPRHYEDLYFELLFAVETRFPFESRHETALKYIRAAEAGDTRAMVDDNQSPAQK